MRVTTTRLSRREVLKSGGACVAAAIVRPIAARTPRVRVFDVAKYGAAGDGIALDSPAIQRAIDEAAACAGNARVLLRGGRKYLVGTLELKGKIDFHLADDVQLLASLRREDYLGAATNSPTADRMASGMDAVIVANGVQGLKISGTGTLQGRAREFMTGYDKVNEWWHPKAWRPKMFVLKECRDLEVRDITFAEAPNWGLHMLGCDGVRVDNVKVRNLLDVPNCDGIDPDHSRNVEITNCNIVSGDDAIVIKASRQSQDYGPSANISVRDCLVETQDAGLKIGTETTSDVHDIRFERCHIKTSSRGLCIQLRDEGSVYNILVQNVTGRAENSVRVWGSPGSRAHDIVFDHVDLTLARWTRYKGGLYDNRPTSAIAPIEPHETVGFSIQNADNVTLRDCKLRWGANPPEYFGEALQSKDCTGVKVERFDGGAAHAQGAKG